MAAEYGDRISEEGAVESGVATWTAGRLAAAIAARQLGSRELLDAYLDRIERLDPPVNAVVTLDVERARAEAAAADELAAKGELRGPLHGLPITIKDAIEVAGVRSTGGAVALTDHVPVADAPAVARLKAAGAVVFGKTNVPEWSGDLQTFNEIFGTTNNPWDLGRGPGGSSGGAATAVACGFTSFELGTDIGGSVRIPSHCCGVFGLKPSFGVVPQRGYLDQVGGGTTDADINVFGPIARSAEDLALVLDVVGGPEPERSLAWRLELPPPRHAGLASYRVGVWLEEPSCPLDRDMLAVLRAAVDRVATAGAKVEEAHPPVSFDEQVAVYRQMILPAISPSLDEALRDPLSGSHYQWLQAEIQRARLRSIWAEWFESYDLLLCPVMPTPAFEHNQEGDFGTRTLVVNDEPVPYMNTIQWTGLIGIVGLPSAVPPVGRTPGGLPVGIQVVAPYLRDRDAVHAAGLIAEAAGGGYEPPPGFRG
jgi:amidase